MTPKEVKKFKADLAQILFEALDHQAKHHGQARFVSDYVCPGGAILICGRLVDERLDAMIIEGQLLNGSLDDASAAIDKIKRG